LRRATNRLVHALHDWVARAGAIQRASWSAPAAGSATARSSCPARTWAGTWSSAPGPWCAAGCPITAWSPGPRPSRTPSRARPGLGRDRRPCGRPSGVDRRRGGCGPRRRDL